MPAQLVALSEGPNILLDKPIMLFGRNPECDIQIESRKISRRHCCMAQVNDYLVVRDLGSTNGIRINGVRVVEGRIKAGDELTIGSHRYQVRWDPLESHGTRAPSPAVVPAPPRVHGAPVDDDDLLEECDEPVPLQEPGRPAVGPKPPPPATTAVASEDEDDDSMDVEALDDSMPPLVLPDNLDLEPNSDILSKDPSKSKH